MTKQTISKILTQSAITIVITGMSPFTMSREHKMFDRLVTAVNDKDIKEVIKLIDISRTVKEFTNGMVTVKDGQVFLDGEVLHDVIAERILEMYNQDIDFTYMVKFLENLVQNPSQQSRNELYLFLENGNMPITEDGRFLAYKWVNNDYTDCHTGSFDNSVGKVHKMERRDVDDDRRNTCSNGFHVCTHGYTKFGSRLMVVAVNPRDVVSVPIDYNNAKMRVSEYEVMYEEKPEAYVAFDKSKPVVNAKTNVAVDKSTKAKGQQRDAQGRFIRK